MRAGDSAESAALVADSWIRWLGWASWAVGALGVGTVLILPGPSGGQSLRTAVVAIIAVAFVIFCARLIVAAERYRTRRVALLFLAAGVGLWAVGSATVSASQTVTAVRFPAPGEVLYLASYLGMVAFLLLDPSRRAPRTLVIWLEAAVVCCATACLAGAVLLTSLADEYPRGGLQLLLAVLYPLIDLILTMIVIGQMMVRIRARSRSTAMLALGFFGLAVADSNFLMTLTSRSYSTSLVLDVIWGFSFLAIVAGACARPSPVLAKASARLHVTVLILGAALAVIALVVHPVGVVGWCVMVPAIVTLVAAGVRMAIALREAQGAAEAMQLSLTDELTGLPNRRAILAAVDEALENGAPLGFMLLDLDGFKDINDSVGHALGDVVLTSLGERMRTVLGQKVMVARLGGDEFAILVADNDSVRLSEIAKEVRAVLQDPLRVDGIDLSIEASIGIAVREVGDTSSIELLRRADIAMYEAKGSRVGLLLFDSSQDGFSRQRLRRRDELRQAIAANQLVMWYQPQIDARTRGVVAMEALVRWRHPTDGLLSPIEFLPDVRRSGLMAALTEVVVDRVVADVRRWTDEGFTFRVALNCAPPELVDGRILPRLFKALEKQGVAGDRLLVEVTEDSFLADPERARVALCDLRAHQVQVAVDDYGTGFSSLAYLRDLPVQELKMDRSFIVTVAHDERSRMIVQTTTQMAHALGLRLVAEGVEDLETVAELVPLGVDLFQGYHFARPMPANEVESWVRSWSEEHKASSLSVSEQQSVTSRRPVVPGDWRDTPGWYRDLPGGH